MLSYIKEIANSGLQALPPARGGDAFVLLRTLAAEVERLDPRDFSPSVRTEFAVLRLQLQEWARRSTIGDAAKLKALLQGVPRVLDGYGLPGRGAQHREFRWISDPDLRGIIERDYAELNQILVPDGAWKSAVVLAGSILEAILLDLLTVDAQRYAAANRAAPKVKGSSKDSEQWTLSDMISIATKVGIIPEARARTFDQILRDYRNFVHPRKEQRSAHSCGEGEALMAKGAIDALCDHFDRHL